MAFFRWALFGVVWLAAWVAAVLLGGLLGGTQGALGWGLLVYPWVALSAAFLWQAWRQARREEADGTLFLRRCLACGRAVSEETVICPDQACDGVDFGYQWDVHRRDEAYRGREAATVAADLNRERARRIDQMGWIGTLTWRPYWSLVGWYVRGVFGRSDYGTETEQLLWWSSRLLAIGGVFAALVVNATGGQTWSSTDGALESLVGWGRILTVLVAALAVSGWIAVSGPGSMRARLRTAERITISGQATPRAGRRP